MDSLITIEVDVKEVGEYIGRLSEQLTRIIAVSNDVSLANDSMESQETIGIDDWHKVEKTIATVLGLNFNAIKNKTALPVPIPVPWCNLLCLIAFRGCKDRRGEFRFVYEDLDVDLDDLDEPASALFGQSGYFRNHYDFYSSTEYLDGIYPKPILFTYAKENDILSKDKTIKSSTKHRHTYSVPVPAKVASGARRLYTGIDGYESDLVGICNLLPNAVLSEPDDEMILNARLIETTAIDSDIGESARPQLAAFWMSSQRSGLIAVRNVLQVGINYAMFSDVQRTLLNAEAYSPSGDLPTNISTSTKTQDRNATPELQLDAKGITQWVMSALLTMNPHLYADLQPNSPPYLHINTIAKIMRKASSTATLSESLRAHKTRFLTFNSGSDGEPTGLTLCALAFDPGSKDTLLETRSPVQMEAIRDIIRRMLNAYPSILQAPMISQDFNKVQISAKYAVLATSDTKDDNTSSDVIYDRDKFLDPSALWNFLQRSCTMELQTKGSDQEYEIDLDSVKTSLGLFNFPQQEVDSIANKFKELADYRISTEGTQILDRDISDEGWRKEVKFREFKLGFFDATDKIVNSGTQIRPTPVNTDISLYYFTKIKELKIRKSAKELALTYHYPVIPKDDHVLIKNGYYRINRVFKSNVNISAAANLINRNTGKPVTPFGIVLQTFFKEGGNGFGSILGSLVGGGLGELGKAVGVPEIGQIGGAIAGTLGQVADVALSTFTGGLF